MSEIVNAGKDFVIMNVQVSQNDNAINLSSGYTPATPPSGYVGPQILNVNSILIRCRSAVDLQLRKGLNDTTFFTIPAGTSFTFDLNPSTTPAFWLRAGGNATVIAEIILTLE